MLGSALKQVAPTERHLRGPVRRARFKLSNTVRKPIRRLEALALLLRDRDWTDEEVTLACALTEQIRDCVRVVRQREIE